MNYIHSLTITWENDTILTVFCVILRYEKERKEIPMEDGSNPIAGIFIFAGVILADFVIFGFYAAMQNLNETAIEKMAKNKKTRAMELLLKYMDKAERYTHICQLLILAAHMLLGFFEVPLWIKYFLSGKEHTLLFVLAHVAIFLALIFLVLVFGIYTPEKVAARKPESWALRLVVPVHALELFLFPLIWLTDVMSNMLARVFGVDPLSDTDDVTEEEIISMVNEGHEQGVLLASEAEMIHNIFEFGDKEAKDIMTHRKNIVALDGEKSFRETLLVIQESNYSRFPVYVGDIDNIIGVLHIKEALDLSMDASVYEIPIKDMEGMILAVDFIPETRNINALFAAMQSDKSHMVIVVDEYGQTAGLVAMEDILEEIVGNIEDEHDDEETMIERCSDGSYLMRGMTPFDEVIEELGVEREEEADEFETLSGFLIALLGRIPGEHEVFSTTAYGYLFEILAVENKMIKNVHVVRLPEEAAENGGTAASPTDEETCQKSE